MESLAWAVRRVWLTYWRVVLSLSAIFVTEKPLLISAQTAFWLWLRGAETEQFGGISICKHITIYKHLNFLQNSIIKQFIECFEIQSMDLLIFSRLH